MLFVTKHAKSDYRFGLSMFYVGWLVKFFS